MPVLFSALLVVLVLAVVFVNGWTDAPNAIACAVGTGAIPFSKAAKLAAVCNLLGLVGISLVNASVADTVTAMVDFGDAGLSQSVAALCAAMLSIVLFSVCAWYFGIPTSESHALLAALAGASLSVGSAGPAWAAWSKVLAGLVMSLLLGFALGWLLQKTAGRVLARLGTRMLDRLQVLSAAGMAAMHGAQDGQKFVAVFVAADLLARGQTGGGAIHMGEHLLAFAACAVVMALGTAVGGKRIVQAVGSDMVSLKKHQGVCADLGGGLCLLLASLTGVPMSTTHTKTTAMMGAGVAGSPKSANPSLIRGMLAAWAVTFPACGLLGYLLCRLFLLFIVV